MSWVGGGTSAVTVVAGSRHPAMLWHRGIRYSRWSRLWAGHQSSAAPGGAATPTGRCSAIRHCSGQWSSTETL